MRRSTGSRNATATASLGCSLTAPGTGEIPGRAEGAAYGLLCNFDKRFDPAANSGEIDLWIPVCRKAGTAEPVG
jgi:hypothetical protein